MIDETQVKKYICMVKELKADFVFYDSHTHPFDVIFDPVDYRTDKTRTGLFSTKGSGFISPKLVKIALEQKGCDLKTEVVDQTMQSKISEMLVRRIYSHTGPYVFKKHMGLCGIDKSLLLPVAPASGSIEDQMLSMARIYGSDKRFEVGTSIPNSIKNADIYPFINETIKKHGIKAVKIHPNITEIKIGSSSGKQRIDALLTACGEFGIPLIVHGGKSKVLKNSAASEYGSIDNLKHINWGLCKSTVVIAHAGGYSCTFNEIEQEIMPHLKKMLRSHDNLMVDIAALDITVLKRIFRDIESDRILFGSDALYEQQWASVVKIMHALTQTVSTPEDKFIQMASINPSKFIFT